MITWIDIEDASGNKLGDGPLTAVLSSTFGEALSEASKFSFTVLTSDPRVSLINYELVAVRYIIVHGMTIRQAGIIKSIELSIAAGLPAYVISGLNLLYELSYPLIQVELFDFVEKRPYILYEDEFIDSHNNGKPWLKSRASDGNPNTHESFNISRNDNFIYIAHEYPFVAMTFDLKNGNENRTNFGWYWRDENWVLLTSEEDNLIDETVKRFAGENMPRPLFQSGRVSFIAPSAWRKRSFNGAINNSYSIKFDPDYGDNVNVEIREVTVTAKGPTTNDLLPLLAGTGWDLVGHQNTGETTRMLFWDISILEALVKLAEYRGHAFRQAQGGRHIEWLRSQDLGEESNITIIAAKPGQVVYGNVKDIAYISTARRLIESFDVVTAVRPYGGSIGRKRMTCKGATWVPPQGYRFDESMNLVISEEAESRLGRRIQKVEQFGLVSSAPDALGNPDTSDAANELLKAAVAWLQKRDKPHRAFDIEVIGLSKLPKVGQKIKIEYLDPAQNIFINDSLFILSIDINLNQQGIVTYKFTVSSVPYWPLTTADYLTQTRQKLQELIGYEQAVSEQVAIATVTEVRTSTQTGLTDEEVQQLESLMQNTLNSISQLEEGIQN